VSYIYESYFNNECDSLIIDNGSNRNNIINEAIDKELKLENEVISKKKKRK